MDQLIKKIIKIFAKKKKKTYMIGDKRKMGRGIGILGKKKNVEKKRKRKTINR